MRRLVTVLALLSSLVSSAEGSGCVGLTGLAEWLCTSKLVLGDIPLPGTSITLHALTCEDTVLGTILSQPDPHADPTTLVLALSGVSVHCTAKNVDLPVYGSHDISLTIEGLAADIVLAVGFSDGLPVGALLTENKCTIDHLDLKCTSGTCLFLQSAISLFKSAITSLIESVRASSVCERARGGGGGEGGAAVGEGWDGC